MSRDWKVIVAAVSGDLVHARTAYGCVLPMMLTSTVPRMLRPAVGSFSGHAQNMVVGRTLDDPQDFTHILTIEPDMMFPPDALDRLLAHDVDVVGATYRRRGPPYELVYYPTLEAPPILDKPRPKGIHEWRAIPAGLMLARMEVFQAIKYPWFWDIPGSKFGDWMTIDMFFCDKARAAGFKVWCDYDLSAEVGHIASMPLMLEGDAPTE